MPDVQLVTRVWRNITHNKCSTRRHRILKQVCGMYASAKWKMVHEISSNLTSFPALSHHTNAVEQQLQPMKEKDKTKRKKRQRPGTLVTSHRPTGRASQRRSAALPTASRVFGICQPLMHTYITDEQVKVVTSFQLVVSISPTATRVVSGTVGKVWVHAGLFGGNSTGGIVL